MLRRLSVFVCSLLVVACDSVVDPPASETNRIPARDESTINMAWRNWNGTGGLSFRGVRDIYLPRTGFETERGPVYLSPSLGIENDKYCPDFIRCKEAWQVIPNNDEARRTGQGWDGGIQQYNLFVSLETTAVQYAFFATGTEWLITNVRDTLAVHVLDHEQQGGPCLLSPDSSDAHVTQTTDRCKPSVVADSIVAWGDVSPPVSKRIYFDYGSPPWESAGAPIRYGHPKDPPRQQILISIQGRTINARTHRVINDADQGAFMARALCNGAWFGGDGPVGGEGRYGTFAGSFVVTGYAGWRPESLTVTLGFHPFEQNCGKPPPSGPNICLPPIYPDFKESSLELDIPVDYTTTPPTAKGSIDWYLSPKN